MDSLTKCSVKCALSQYRVDIVHEICNMQDKSDNYDYKQACSDIIIMIADKIDWFEEKYSKGELL